MAVPTVNVTVDLYNQNGTAIAGAVVTALLSGIDTYLGQYVDPMEVRATTNGSGQAILALFPNELGGQNRYYTFEAWSVDGYKIFTKLAIVPNSAVNLETIDTDEAAAATVGGFPDGTLSILAMRFTNEPSTGRYRVSAGIMADVVLSNEIVRYTATGLSFTKGLTFQPANANAVLSPTGTGTVTINPATAGTVNNMVMGGTTPLAGTFTTLSALVLRARDTDASHWLTLAPGSNLTADRTLTFTTGDANRTINLAGDLVTTGGSLTFSLGGTTTITLPASGTMVTTASANVWTDANSFIDTNLTVVGSADNTKKLRFEVDGITAGQTRVWTPFDRDGFVQLAEDGWLHNVAFAVSVSGNALTVALKTKAGADPSAADPVYIGFRNETLTTGDYTVLKITAAASFVVSSGSTLGTVSGQAHRIYIVGVNDGGTFRLGVWNPWNNTAKALYALDESLLATSTAEGGAGGADSAHVLYTGTAVSAKPGRILGYFESTQTTAGTWAAEESKIQVMSANTPRTGGIIQRIHTFSGALATGTTTVPKDDTIPQNTEGFAVSALDTAITPTSAINLLSMHAITNIDHSTSDAEVFLMLFEDSVADALAISRLTQNSGGAVMLSVNHMKIAGSTSTTTKKVRVGSSDAGTLSVNGQAGLRIFGGVMCSSLTTEEIFV